MAPLVRGGCDEEGGVSDCRVRVARAAAAPEPFLHWDMWDRSWDMTRDMGHVPPVPIYNAAPSCLAVGLRLLAALDYVPSAPPPGYRSPTVLSLY